MSRRKEIFYNRKANSNSKIMIAIFSVFFVAQDLTPHFSSHSQKLNSIKCILASLIASAHGAGKWISPCNDVDNSFLPFCNQSLSVEDRAKDLVGRISKVGGSYTYIHT